MSLANRTVLVTGASGFAGGHLAVRLAAAEGARVRALVRSTSRVDDLDHPGIELRYGDVTDLASVMEATRGADVVFHLAAKVGHWGDADEFRRVNLVGTDNVLAASRRAQVSRVIHTSTIGVYGLDPVDGTDESAPFVRSESAYCNSKIEAEELVFDRWREEGLPVTVIRPAEIYGPRSAATTVGPLLAIKMGWMQLIDHGIGICNHLYVGNLVDSFVLAANSTRAIGQGYIISDGVPSTYAEFFGHYARMAGKGALPSMSMEQALVVAERSEARAERTGRAPAMTGVSIGFLTQRASFRIDKARAELGYEPRVSLAEGMRLTEVWLRGKGYL